MFMDLLLENGDHKKDFRGFPQSVQGVRELIQRAMIRLSVKQGSFAPDPKLGSRLQALKNSALFNEEDLLSAVREALEPVEGIEAEQISVVCNAQSHALILSLYLTVLGDLVRVEMPL